MLLRSIRELSFEGVGTSVGDFVAFVDEDALVVLLEGRDLLSLFVSASVVFLELYTVLPGK